MNLRYRSGGRRRLWLLSVLVFAAALGTSPAGAQAPECDRDCLIDLMQRYLDAMLAFDQMELPAEIAPLPWADRVRFSENDVGLMIGDGLWGTLTAVGDGYTVADPEAGNILWLGVVEEHGQSAYLALRLGVEGGAIAEVEAIVGREGTPAPFAPTAGYTVDRTYARTVADAQRTPRARLEALVEGYYSSVQLNDGTVQTEIADDCVRLSNGFSTTHGDGVDVTGCREQLQVGWYRHVDRVRARRLPIIDEARGVVVAIAFLDHAARNAEYQTLDGRTRNIPVGYPNSHGVLGVFKIEDGRIGRIVGVASCQPYLMPTRWVP
jgi:hypothetical protein